VVAAVFEEDDVAVVDDTIFSFEIVTLDSALESLEIDAVLSTSDLQPAPVI